jgi:hypothetical protein
MDDHSAGRGVYVVRRILAVLVILLLLALLVPQAYQALLAPRDGTGSGVQDTDSSSDGGSDEESAANGETAGVADDVAEQKDARDNQIDSGETVARDGAQRTGGGVETNEEVYGGVENMELDTELAGAGGVFEEVAVGDVDLIAPILAFYGDGQQTINPTVPVEPIVSASPPVSTEPIAFEDSIVPEYLAYYEDPAYYEYLAYYEDPAYYEYLAYYEDPVSYEEQIFEESAPLDAYDTAASETASDEESGGSGAYAAISAD